MSGVELLAPAGDFGTALAAFAAGADAVYCGLSEFSARAFAKNLSFAELADLIACARDGTFGRRRRVYVAFNTVVDELRMGAALETAARLAELG
ncbi:MAG: U32 family peptidase, partial [Kiritimatiellae bacterium]|nr:U32 family peptidase [Kiritimatiellia bacterium]